MRDTWLVVVLVLIVNAIYFAFRHDNAKRAKFAAKFAMWMMIGFSVLAILFISGYAMEEPGGLQGSLMVAGMVVPTIGFGLLAWKKPAVTRKVLYAFLGISVVANLLTAIFPHAYWTFFMNEGPWLGVGSFIFTVIAAIYGYHADRRLAGIMLLVITIIPFFVVLITVEPMAAIAGGSSAALMTPGFAAGLLLLLSDRLQKSVK